MTLQNPPPNPLTQPMEGSSSGEQIPRGQHDPPAIVGAVGQAEQGSVRKTRREKWEEVIFSHREVVTNTDWGDMEESEDSTEGAG